MLALDEIEHSPTRLTPGTLDGHVILVTGRVGAVWHTAIQLSR